MRSNEGNDIAKACTPPSVHTLPSCDWRETAKECVREKVELTRLCRARQAPLLQSQGWSAWNLLTSSPNSQPQPEIQDVASLTQSRRRDLVRHSSCHIQSFGISL